MKKLANNRNLDFSIIIPTYNRSNFIGLAIRSVLQQKNVSFEILVSDDASTDDTEKTVKSFHDSRIVYWKNKIRLGTAMNFQKCFLRSSGEYIFTLGDDDFILDEFTLIKILKIMKKYKLGMGKIGTFTYELTPKSPYQELILSDKLIVLKPKSTKNILTESIDFGLGFFSGLTYNNRLMDKKLLHLDHICNPNHMCPVERLAAYNLIIKNGIAYIPKLFIVSHLSLYLIPRYFDIKKSGWFFMEKPITLAKKIINDQEFENFKKNYLRRQMILLPNIKFFTNTKNYIKTIHSMIQIDHSLMYDVRFVSIILIGFLPKFIIKIIRDIKILLIKKSIKKSLIKYNYYKKYMKLIRNTNFL